MLLDSVAFAMGRDIDGFRGVVDEHLREVEVGIRTKTGTYLLRRSRRSASVVEVIDESGTRLGRFPVKDGSDPGQRISSWLLERVDLDEAFSAVRLSGGRTLDFGTALLPYCYLNQWDIDRHIIQSSRMDDERYRVLRLVLNLTTVEYERLSAEIKDVDIEIGRRRRRAQEIVGFLDGSAATRGQAVQEEIRVLREQEADAKAWLAQVRDDASAATVAADRERRLVREARGDVGDAEIRLDNLRKRHRSALDKVQEWEGALGELDSQEEAAARIPVGPHPVEMFCCNCGSSLHDRMPEPGQCYVCLGPLPPHRREAERVRIGGNLALARQEASQLESQVIKGGEQAQRAFEKLQALTTELDDRTRDSVTPYVEAISHASAELARVQQELASLNRIGDAHSRLGRQFDEITELEKEQAERRHRLVLDSAKVRPLEDVLEHLNGLFRQIIRGINLPNSTGRARLHAETLLPLVDEQEFHKRGGGARAAVSIAYSLALLTYVREQEDAKLPAFLMVDSPQKNLGSNQEDKALSRRVYERFIDYMDELDADERFRRPFQVIIVDNDIPTDIARRMKVVNFDRENGFIRDLKTLNAGDPVQMSIDDLDDSD
jgi:DNA repair exonuclease SbcCD ATPase subunit